MAVFFEPQYSVQESVLEVNPRTGVIREIDIRITSRSDPKDRLLVECRAHKRRQDVQWIDALDGKRRSLGYDKVVAVSSSGFTKAALAEARDRGIETLHLREAEEADWRNWFMAIPELGVELTKPVFRSAEFGVDAAWPGKIPESMDLTALVLVDTRDGTRIPFFTWVSNLLNDPRQAAQLQALAIKGNVTDLQTIYPCAPGMGFVLEGQELFVPLVQLVIHVDLDVSHDVIPLTHFDAGGQRVLAGESQIRGIPSRVVMHERKNEGLTILFEQTRPKKDGQS